jgi:hypothetical protein
LREGLKEERIAEGKEDDEEEEALFCIQRLGGIFSLS